MHYELILNSLINLKTNFKLKALLFCQQITMNIKRKLSTRKQQMANVPEFFIKWTFLFHYQLPSVRLLSVLQAWH